MLEITDSLFFSYYPSIKKEYLQCLHVVGMLRGLEIMQCKGPTSNVTVSMHVI